MLAIAIKSCETGSGMDRVVIITGAGAGLGRALARLAAADGDRIVAIGRNEASLIETGAGLNASRYRYKVCDVADTAMVDAAISGVAAEYGRIDGLFANAAVYPRVAFFDQSIAGLLDALAVNVGGVAAACRAVLPAMIRAGHGRIVIVGSYADREPIPLSSAYAASKGALHALTKAIAVEVAATCPDILVNEWIPGALDTRMGAPDGIDPDVAARWGLALLDLPAGGPNGRQFLRDQLVLPPLPLRERIIRKIGLR